MWVEDSTTNSQALLEGVADGTIDYTIADSTEFAFAHDVHPDLRIAFDFPAANRSRGRRATAIPNSVQDMGAYFATLNASGDLAAIVNRYYGRSEDAELAEAPDFMRHLQSRLPLYKKWFEEAADAEQPGLAAARGHRLSGIQMESARRLRRRARSGSCN